VKFGRQATLDKPTSRQEALQRLAESAATRSYSHDQLTGGGRQAASCQQSSFAATTRAKD